MSTTAPINGDPDFRHWRNSQNTFSPTSSGSSTSSTAPSPSSMPEFALTSKTSRKLSLQTYLATLPEWSSSTRLVSLYSEFDKLKETNPFGYEANVSWWRTVILGAARNGLLSTYQPVSPTVRYSVASSYSSQDPRSPSGIKGSKPVYESTGSAIGVLELDLEQLGIKFQKNGRRPNSLQAVMNEMSRMGEVVPRSEFLPWAGVGWTGWIFHKVVKAPLLWSLKQLSLSESSSSSRYSASPTLVSTGFGSPGGVGSGANGNIGVGGSAGAGTMLSGGNGLGLGLSTSTSGSHSHRDTYVIVPYVQEAAARIMKLQQESAGYHASDNLMTFEDFRQRFSRTALLPIRGKHYSDDASSAGSVIVLTDRDLEIVMRYMQFELKVLITGKLDATKYDNEVQDHEMASFFESRENGLKKASLVMPLVIKFATKDAIRDKSKQEITTADRGIIELRETCKRLDIQVQDIEERISELNEKARSCVRKNQRSQATFALRQRKNLEDVLNKRLKSLDTISSILFRIQSSETDAEVLQSYKLGASTLASVMATKGQNGEQLLSVDSVESTMDRLADVFADQEEVDQAMSEGTEVLLQSTTSGVNVDEDDLIAELDALMDQGQKESNSPARKNVTPRKHASPERHIPIKRTTPPIPTEPILSPPSPSSPREYGMTHSTSGKRVAEIPEQTFVKQRKVSQTNVHSQRKGSSDVQGNEESTAEGSKEQEAMVVADPTELEDARPPSRMETDQMPFLDANETPEPEQIPVSTESQCLSSQEERDIAAILDELEGIEAPDVDTPMQGEKPHSVDEEEDDSLQEESEEPSNTRGSSKPRKETRMLELN
ncbi:hypothetical protein BGX27_002216 [Mortierella sp. AM989]|nr:hypothetical protein BGX27_002216 [Mortierella sp. AM989]